MMRHLAVPAMIAVALVALAVGLRSARPAAPATDPAAFVASAPGTASAASACEPVALRTLQGEPLPARPASVEQEGSEPIYDVALYRTDAVRLRVCTPGRLQFVARGSTAAGRGPWLVVASGASVLFEGEVAGPRTFDLPLAEPGWLLLAFPNDLAIDGGDRNLWLDDLGFVADR